MTKKDKSAMFLYIFLTFSISWSIWLLSGVLNRKGDFVYDTHWLISQTGVFIPSILAAIFMLFNLQAHRNKSIAILLLTIMILTTGFMIGIKSPDSIDSFTGINSLSIGLTAIISIYVIYRVRYFYLPDVDRKNKSKIAPRWILGAVFLLPAIFLIAWLLISLTSLTTAVSGLQEGIIKFIKLVLVAFSMNFILGGSMGEEFGWRGYVLPLLLKYYTPVQASLILGLIWAFWHIPIDLTSGSVAGPVAVVLRIVWTLPLTIVMTWFFIKTAGSILIAMLMHTSVNVLPDLGFENYESALIFMTLLLIFTATLIGFKPGMRYSDARSL